MRWKSLQRGRGGQRWSCPQLWAGVRLEIVGPLLPCGLHSMSLQACVLIKACGRAARGLGAELARQRRNGWRVQFRDRLGWTARRLCCCASRIVFYVPFIVLLCHLTGCLRLASRAGSIKAPNALCGRFGPQRTPCHFGCRLVPRTSLFHRAVDLAPGTRPPCALANIVPACVACLTGTGWPPWPWNSIASTCDALIWAESSRKSLWRGASVELRTELTELRLLVALFLPQQCMFLCFRCCNADLISLWRVMTTWNSRCLVAGTLSANKLVTFRSLAFSLECRGFGRSGWGETGIYVVKYTIRWERVLALPRRPRSPCDELGLTPIWWVSTQVSRIRRATYVILATMIERAVVSCAAPRGRENFSTKLNEAFVRHVGIQVAELA